LADKSTQLILDALCRAVADPAGAPLYGSKAKAGLFATTAPGRQAVQRCKEHNWLRVVRTEKRGKTEVEIGAITETGLAYLLSQVSPKQVLEDLVRALEDRQQQVGALVAAAHETQASLDLLRAIAEKVLQTVGSAQPAAPPTNGTSTHVNGTLTHGQAAAQPMAVETWPTALPAFLIQWRAAHPTEDCSLPELYRQAQAAASNLTVGAFHDGLRRLHEQGQIYLHPWTGPLHDLPEPALALLIGHEIAYYASIRN
jgi:hypothetical protein